MTDTQAKLALLSLLLPSLAACDDASPSEAASELAPVLEVRTLAPSPSVREADRLEPATLERTKLEPGSFEPAKTCGAAAVSVPSDLCPPGRRVGKFNGGCPKPPGAGADDPHWEVEAMFSGVDDLPGALEGFCRYVWVGDPAALTPLPKSISTGPDCRVFPQSPMAPALNSAYRTAFTEGTLPLRTKPTGGVGVTIAVVDTAPAKTIKGQAGHGQTMAAIAAELAGGCAPGLEERHCKREVVTTLGLPQTRTGPDLARGGFYGYQSELAEGIARAIADWGAGSDDHLVLNLSVGWEPTPNEFSNPSPAVEAVRDALAIGHCRGALIVAASGNRPENTCFGDATGPGGWEREPGYSAAQCGALGLPNAAIALPNPLPAYHPFLYAATPLDWRRGNLVDAREDSNARLAATGFAGFDEVRGHNYGPLTGSSVSTAVISGTAALAWSYFNSLSADEIMALLYDAGAPTAGDVTLALANASPEQRQVTACAPLQWACDPARIGNYLGGNQQTPSVCAALGDCSPLGTPPDVNRGAWATAFTVAFGQLPSSDYENSNAPAWSTINCTQCGSNQITHLPLTGDSTEPAHMGWVVPEPHKPPCPHCRIKGPDLYLALDPDYDSFVLEDLSIYLYDSAGGSEVLHYDPARLTAPLNSRTVEVVFDTELLTVSAGLPPAQAYVLMSFSDPNAAATGGTGGGTAGGGTAAGTTGGLITAGNALPLN